MHLPRAVARQISTRSIRGPSDCGTSVSPSGCCLVKPFRVLRRRFYTGDNGLAGKNFTGAYSLSRDGCAAPEGFKPHWQPRARDSALHSLCGGPSHGVARLDSQAIRLNTIHRMSGNRPQPCSTPAPTGQVASNIPQAVVFAVFIANFSLCLDYRKIFRAGAASRAAKRLQSTNGLSRMRAPGTSRGVRCPESARSLRNPVESTRRPKCPRCI